MKPRFNFRLPGYKVTTIVVLLGVAALVGLWWGNRKPLESVSPLGPVHHSDMIFAYQPNGIARWIDRNLPLPIKFSRLQNQNHSRYLTLGTNQVYWSPNDLRKATGWIMFWHPFTTNAVWEFAKCSKTNWTDFELSDLNAPFIGIGDPRGTALFSTNWATNGIRVTEGEIVLARRTGELQPVYVVLMKRHARKFSGKTEIEYLVLSTNAVGSEVF